MCVKYFFEIFFTSARSGVICPQGISSKHIEYIIKIYIINIIHAAM